MNKLNKRERLLIYICLLVVIVVGGIYLMIIPAAEQNLVLQDTYSTLEMTVDETDYQISMIPAYRQDIAKLKEDIAKLSVNFYDLSVNEKLDYMLTSMLLRNNLTPLSLQMTDTGSLPVTPFGVVSGRDGEEGSGYPLVATNTFMVEGVGNETDLLDFLDKLNTLPYLRIINCSVRAEVTTNAASPNPGDDLSSAVGTQVSGAGYNNGRNQQIEFTAQLEIYMEMIDPAFVSEDNDTAISEGETPPTDEGDGQPE